MISEPMTTVVLAPDVPPDYCTLHQSRSVDWNKGRPDRAPNVSDDIKLSWVVISNSID